MSGASISRALEAATSTLFQLRIEMLPTQAAVTCLSLDNIAIKSKTLGCDNRSPEETWQQPRAV